MTVLVSLVTQPKTDEQLGALMWALTPKRVRNPEREANQGGWYRSPVVLGGGVLALTVSSTSSSARRATTWQPRNAPSEQDYSDSAVVHDDMIASAEAATRGSTNLFDLRTVIGALFTLYGVLLVILGIFD